MENVADGPLGCPRAARFNAATTRRPWRTAGAAAGRPSPRRFNAATTRRPWRTDLAEIIKQAGLELQCGHDPKAVENDVARALDEPDGKQLQCGHDPKAVESSAPKVLIPEPHWCFNAATTRRPWRTKRLCRNCWVWLDVASMRPRPEGRGERWESREREHGASCELQCGHDPKAVENLTVT